VPEKPRLATLGRSSEEHKVGRIDIGTVDVFERKHIRLNVFVEFLVRQEWPLKR